MEAPSSEAPTCSAWTTLAYPPAVASHLIAARCGWHLYRPSGSSSAEANIVNVKL